jgi:hypothetical protein
LLDSSAVHIYAASESIGSWLRSGSDPVGNDCFRTVALTWSTVWPASTGCRSRA